MDIKYLIMVRYNWSYHLMQLMKVRKTIPPIKFEFLKALDKNAESEKIHFPGFSFVLLFPKCSCA